MRAHESNRVFVSLYLLLSPYEIVGLRPGSHSANFAIVYATYSTLLNRLRLRLLNEQDFAEFNEDATKWFQSGQKDHKG